MDLKVTEFKASGMARAYSERFQAAGDLKTIETLKAQKLEIEQLKAKIKELRSAILSERMDQLRWLRNAP